MGLLISEALEYDYQQYLIGRQAERILSCCDPSALILFGSAARNQMTDASDIDIALLFPDTESLIQAKRRLYALPPCPDPWPCDMVCYTIVEFQERVQRGGLCELIREEGRLLYGRWP